MKKNLMFCSLSLVLTLTGCAWWDSWWNDWSTKNEEYGKLIAQAENEIKLADKTGFLWRDTEKFLKESKEAKAAADKAVKDGDRASAKAEFDTAMQLAQKAMTQAQMAQQQARDNVNPAVSYK